MDVQALLSELLSNPSVHAYGLASVHAPLAAESSSPGQLTPAEQYARSLLSKGDDSAVQAKFVAETTALLERAIAAHVKENLGLLTSTLPAVGNSSKVRCYCGCRRRPSCYSLLSTPLTGKLTLPSSLLPLSLPPSLPLSPPYPIPYSRPHLRRRRRR